MAASIAARLAAAPEALALKLDCGAAIASDGAEDCTGRPYVAPSSHIRACHHQQCCVCAAAAGCCAAGQQSVSLGDPSHLRLQRIANQWLRVGRRPCSATAPAGGAVAALHGPFACRQQGSVTHPFCHPQTLQCCIVGEHACRCPVLVLAPCAAQAVSSVWRVVEAGTTSMHVNR
jgi:hypothetical protein